MEINVTRDKIIYWILSSTLVIDFVNGVWMNISKSNHSNIGILIRLIILLYCYIILMKINKKSFMFVNVACLFFTTNTILSYFIYHHSIKGLVFDISLTAKYMFLIVLTELLINLFRNGELKKQTVIKAIFNNLNFLIFFNLIAYIFKFGRSTYAANTGFKGAFVSTNAINIVMIIFLIFSLERLLNKKSNLLDKIIFLLLFLNLILLGSKSSYIFLVFIILLYFIYGNIKVINSYKKFILVILTFIVIIIMIVICFKSQFINIINRQRYLFKINNGNIISYLLSSRDTFLKASWISFKKDFSLTRLFIGVGSYQNNLNIMHLLGRKFIKSIEMDIFDIFFSYGIIGLLITYGYTFKIYIVSRKKGKFKEFAASISFICIIIFSILGGYVYGNVMSSTFFAMVMLLLFSHSHE